MDHLLNLKQPAHPSPAKVWGCAGFLFRGYAAACTGAGGGGADAVHQRDEAGLGDEAAGAELEASQFLLFYQRPCGRRGYAEPARGFGDDQARRQDGGGVGGFDGGQTLAIDVFDAGDRVTTSWGVPFFWFLRFLRMAMQTRLRTD